MNPENALNEITKLINSHNEWLLLHDSGKTFALQTSEIEITFERGKLFFGFLDDAGFQIWRVAAFKIENDKITFELTRNFEKEKRKIHLVPRISAGELSAGIELARLEKANQIAAAIKENARGAKLIRAALSSKTGRFAQIIFENPNKAQIAVLSDVSEIATPEILLTTAILWLAKLELRRKNPIERIRILAGKKAAKNLQKLHALLAENWRRKISIVEISRKNSGQKISELKPIALKNLWREKPARLKPAEHFEMSRSAREIIKLAPGKIDLIFNRHGETLRFFGLPFARVRKLAGAEKVWFGIEQNRRILNEKTKAEFFDFLEALETYRRFDSMNKRHAFYQTASESWLEAILKRNIKLLDPNLVLSPIYNQFRASNDKIDLLALRKDGRLIVIELKTAPDREMIFQAVDYWRKIELHRRAGNLKKARVFGDLEISDKPAIVYLAAPTLSFHVDFSFLAKTISPEIEIYRFDLNENWRENLKVTRVSEVKEKG